MKAYVALLTLMVAVQEPTIRVNVQLQQVHEALEALGQ